MGDASGQLAERSHLLGLDQTGLGGFEIAISRFGSLPSGVNFGLRPFALGDVAVNNHDAAIRHRVIPNFNNRAIRARALELIMFVEAFPQAFDFGLRVGLAELAALSEIADVLVEAMTLSEIIVR